MSEFKFKIQSNSRQAQSVWFMHKQTNYIFCNFIRPKTLSRLKTDSFVSFFTIYLFYNMPIRTTSVTFFFTVYSLLEYVQSNQSNTRDRKNRLQQEQTRFLECSSLFFSQASSSSLLNKESMIGLNRYVLNLELMLLMIEQ